jgi:hypothetical protein
MAERLRLSEASRQTAAALAVFDGLALEELLAQLHDADAGRVAIEREPVEAIRARQRVLAEVLTATEQNIGLLRRLRERKVGNQWEL